MASLTNAAPHPRSGAHGTRAPHQSSMVSRPATCSGNCRSDKQHLAQLRAHGAEGDRLEALAIAGGQRAADVIAPAAVGIDARGGRERRRPVRDGRAIGPRLFQQFDQLQRCRPGRERGIDRASARPGRPPPGGRSLSSRKPRRSPSRARLTVRPAAMAWPPPLTITPASKAARTALPMIDARRSSGRSPRRARRLRSLRQHEARQVEAFLEARRGEPDTPGCQPSAEHHDHRAAPFLAQRGVGLHHGLVDDARVRSPGAPGSAARAPGRSAPPRPCRASSAGQRQRRIADPPGGIDARPRR